MKAVDVVVFADLIVAVALCAVWLTGALVADGLAGARTAGELRRRARVLSIVVGAGLVLSAGGLFVPGGVGLPAAGPAVLVLAVTVRRLGQVRRGARAIETTPRTPVPPALRAAAGHPLLVVPVQVTGLAALLGLPIAARVVSVPAAGPVGVAITVGVLAVAVIGIRAVVRHSTLRSEGVASPSIGSAGSVPEKAGRE